jgi:hypothetical protein
MTPMRLRLAGDVQEIEGQSARGGANMSDAELARRLRRRAGVLRACDPVLADEVLRRAKALDPRPT